MSGLQFLTNFMVDVINRIKCVFHITVFLHLGKMGFCLQGTVVIKP